MCLNGHIGPIPTGGDSSWRRQLDRPTGLVCSSRGSRCLWNQRSEAFPPRAVWLWAMPLGLPPTREQKAPLWSWCGRCQGWADSMSTSGTPYPDQEGEVTGNPVKLWSQVPAAHSRPSLTLRFLEVDRRVPSGSRASWRLILQLRENPPLMGHLWGNLSTLADVSRHSFLKGFSQEAT